jgi:hypothetical protein
MPHARKVPVGYARASWAALWTKSARPRRPALATACRPR